MPRPWCAAWYRCRLTEETRPLATGSYLILDFYSSKVSGFEVDTPTAPNTQGADAANQFQLWFAGLCAATRLGPHGLLTRCCRGHL
jgi:hypothetical protein